MTDALILGGVRAFGSSGTRYVRTLATELHRRGARYGVLGVCAGSGQGVALGLENPQAA
jgi:acetyl-CoA acetyltransferase